MPPRKGGNGPNKRAIEQYDHKDKKRLNNPPVGLVTPETDTDKDKKKYQYDPHLDPSLQWAGKAERISFEVPTVSLHVHERIDSRSILEAVRKKNGTNFEQMSLFNSPNEKPPLREAVDFYKHSHNWSNRLIAGDSTLVMNSLIEKEGLSGKVQMFFMDPPYGIKYGSNFQPFVSQRDVKDGKDEDLTQEPEMIRAFRDTWELGIHSYLTYLRDRLFLAKELLSDTGSCFIQISDENLHFVRNLLDEIFGSQNFISLIPFRKKTMQFGTKFLEQMDDFIIWYAKNKDVCKFKKLFLPMSPEGDWHFKFADLPDGSVLNLSQEQINNHALLPEGSKLFRLKPLEPSGPMEKGMFNYNFKGKIYTHPRNGYGTDPTGMQKLEKSNRLAVDGNRLNYKLYVEDYPISALATPWQDTIGPRDKRYVVQTSNEVVQRCMLMTTDPGDLVFDPTCGSGTTSFVAENWGRRWITCDTSRVAITIAKQRLMTSTYEYFELSVPSEGVSSGFRYKVVPHVTLGSIANGESSKPETLFDQPFVSTGKIRVTGPFTVEAVPAPVVKPIVEITEKSESDDSIVRSGETLRQNEWRDELFKTGIRGHGGQKIECTRVEPLKGTRYLHVEAETKEKQPKRMVVSFGPEYAPLEQRQVALALEEAQKYVPKPQIVAFAAFEFDPEAAKDIDETKWPGVTLLKCKMNADLLTEDLKKKRSSNESFWLIGQPEVKLTPIKKGADKGKYQVEILGFDYYNTINGNIESGGKEKIAMWLLDTDYDGRSLFPRQVFFPMEGDEGGWAKLAKNLKAELDEDLIEQYRGTLSVPFETGENKRVAIKIIDNRGIESLKIIEIE